MSLSQFIHRKFNYFRPKIHQTLGNFCFIQQVVWVEVNGHTFVTVGSVWIK